MARKTDPWTSHEASRSVNHSEAKEKALLKILRKPMTDEQMVELYLAKALSNELPWASPSGLRTLRNRLWKDGLVKDTSKTIVTRSGRKAIVWKTA
jgi:hypothetical protein